MFELKLSIIPHILSYQPHWSRRYFCQTLYFSSPLHLHHRDHNRNPPADLYLTSLQSVPHILAPWVYSRSKPNRVSFLLLCFSWLLRKANAFSWTSMSCKGWPPWPTGPHLPPPPPGCPRLHHTGSLQLLYFLNATHPSFGSCHLPPGIFLFSLPPPLCTMQTPDPASCRKSSLMTKIPRGRPQDPGSSGTRFPGTPVREWGQQERDRERSRRKFPPQPGPGSFMVQPTEHGVLLWGRPGAVKSWVLQLSACPCKIATAAQGGLWGGATAAIQ